jgi:hypothetical protein
MGDSRWIGALYRKDDAMSQSPTFQALTGKSVIELLQFGAYL